MRKPSDFANFPDALSALTAFGPYRAVKGYNHDGDSLYAFLDLGVNEYAFRPLRVRGIDAPELKDPGGPEARDYLRALLPDGTHIVVATFRDTTTFGRYVADVQFLLGGVVTDLAEHLLTAGHAVRWTRR